LALWLLIGGLVAGIVRFLGLVRIFEISFDKLQQILPADFDNTELFEEIKDIWM